MFGVNVIAEYRVVVCNILHRVPLDSDERLNEKGPPCALRKLVGGSCRNMQQNAVPTSPVKSRVSGMCKTPLDVS